MNVSIETMSGLERRLTIALASEDFESQITTKLEDARGRVKIPGFRPGKVPLKEVRRRYGNAVRAEVAGELMQSSFYEAVAQEELNPAGQPSLEVVKMDPGIDFEFTATFEVFPSIELGDFSKIEIKRPQAEITEGDVDAMIERLREQRSTFESVERASEEGDQVVVDFKGTLDGDVVDAACAQDATFVIGAGQMIEDFDAGARGLASGESAEFDAVFPDDYRAEELQGKTLHFELTMKDVQAKQVPELDEALFEDFGVTDGGLSAFRDEVRDNMQREMDSAVKNQVKQQVMDGLEKLHEFLLPQAVVHREIHVLKDQMLSQFQMPQQGARTPDLPDELFEEQAQKRVKVGLVVNEVIRQKEIEADEALVDERLKEIAAPYGEPDQVIAYYRSNAEQMQSLEMGVLEDQVVDHIMSEAGIEELISSYDEIIAGTAIAPAQEDAPAEPEETDAAASPEAASPEAGVPAEEVGAGVDEVVEGDAQDNDSEQTTEGVDKTGA
jgi:trigger factor